MKEIIFVIGIFVWCFIGFLSIMHSKDNRVNYEMIIFMALVPFIPLFAKVCGLV